MSLESIKITFKRIGLVAFIYTLCRILFFLFNFKTLKVASFINITKAFIYGLRFDLSIIFLTNSLFFFFSIIPFTPLQQSKSYQHFLAVLFFPVNLLLIYLNLIDVEYFVFRGKRTTAEILGITRDIVEQSGQMILNYWYLVLLAMGITLVLIQFYPQYKKHASGVVFAWYYYYPIVLLICGVYFIIVRGGVQMRPISPNQAFVYSPNILGNLVLNTPFSFLHTLERTEIKKYHFYPDKQVSEMLHTGIIQDYIKEPATVPPNVVIIILESFSSEYTGFGNNWTGYTPFLDSLSAQSTFFKYHLANGTSSIEALPSIIASIPSLMPEAYITSMYQTNKILGLGDVLKAHGYHTSFFHGATNGSMGFDVFAKNAGFENYFGKSEYPDPKNGFDGGWGIYDDLFLGFFQQKLSDFPTPFVSCIFTISSHQPYPIPPRLKNKFPEGPVPIIKSIRYVDNALKTFFEKSSKEKWFDNTLFVITADHTQEKIRERNIFNDYHVPLLFFHAALEKKIVDNKITQHTDIMPSILDILDIPSTNILPFGHSIFDNKDEGKAINFEWGSQKTFLFHFDCITSLTKEGKIAIEESPLRKGAYLKIDSVKKSKYAGEIMSVMQYYNNGLIDNYWIRDNSK